MKESIKIVICADKNEEQQKYSKWLYALGEKHNVRIDLIVYDSAKTLLFDVQDILSLTDAIYLDVNMPGIDGGEVAAQLREQDYWNDIIFLALSKDYVFKAFDMRALHYIIKGETSLAEFEKIFLLALQSKREKNRKYVVYCAGGETRNIPLNSIWYYETRRGIVTVYYDRDKSFEFPQESLQEIENDLEGYGFFRNYRSILVALAAIESITYRNIILHNGEELPLSRHKYAELKALLEPNEGKVVR